MHPKVPSKRSRKSQSAVPPGGNRRPEMAGHAILLPRRRQPVPVNEARLVNLVFDADAKRLSDIARDAKGPVRLPDAIDRSRPPVDLDNCGAAIEGLFSPLRSRLVHRQRRFEQARSSAG
jgi:hypothetical protein